MKKNTLTVENRGSFFTVSTMKALSAVLFLLFCLSIFTNIKYPLLWGDEASTAIGAQRVERFGYPKAHDGKNLFYDLPHKDINVGLDEKTDAYIGGASWAQYYYGVLGLKLTDNISDIYKKTGIYRMTFAVPGVAGTLLLGLFFIAFIRGKAPRYALLALFILLSLLSVSLQLHIREVRYYSLIILLMPLTAGLYCRHRFYRMIPKWVLMPVLFVSLWLVFMTFSPMYLILLVTVGIAEIIIFISHIRNKTPFRKIVADQYPMVAVLLASFLAVLPFMFFFRTFEVSAAMAEYYNYSIKSYFNNIYTVLIYFYKFEWLTWAVILKILLVIFDFRSFLSPGPLHKASLFMSLLFVVFFFAIPYVPTFVYTRYLIHMQPVLSLIIILDLAILFMAKNHGNSTVFHVRRTLTLVLSLAAFIFVISRNVQLLSGRMHELSVQYKGPLDYTIPYIMEHYPRTDTLKIAVNYEETSYDYYLGSKMLVAEGLELDKDTLVIPDIMAFRQRWGSFVEVFNRWGQLPIWRTVKFPVDDYFMNNIPEFNRPDKLFEHQFRTRPPLEDDKQLMLIIRDPSLPLPPR